MKLHGIYIALIVGLLIFSLHTCESKRSLEMTLEAENGSHVNQIARKESQIAHRDTLIANERFARKKQEIEFRVKEKGLTAIIRRQQKTISVIRPEIALTLDSLPLLKTFVSLQDSTIQNLDSLVEAQELACFEMAKSYSTEIGLLNGQINSQKNIADEWRKFSESESKKARKQERKRKFWRGVAVVCGGIAVFMTVQK